MCGINGFISENTSSEKRNSVVQKMNDCLAHRGPDNAGIWSDNKISLGHRRLSIIDLSDESNQPFVSNDARYIIVYNGELYNYKELKLELQRSAQGTTDSPYFFKTGSDTEVVLAAFIRYGNKCLDLFNGMFAFAIYDTKEQKLFIARDRIGVKPLYYYYGEEGFIFSSEVRPILHSGIRSFKLNREVLGEYTMYQTVFSPNTLIKGIKMLEAGHYIECRAQKVEISKHYETSKAVLNSTPLSYKETCSKVNELLTLSVQRRLVADVPFGAFLSGGIDSSIVVGLMSKVSSEKVQTFNVSFDESAFSESVYARQIAKKFNTAHHEIKLKPQEFLNQLPQALHAMDHPSGDGPNTYIVSKATKEAGITMALSGIGGDELFAGYDVFKRMSNLQKKSWLNAIPLFARKAVGYGLQWQNKSVSRNKIAELIQQPRINFSTAYPLNRSLFTKIQLDCLLENNGSLNNIGSIVSEIPQVKDHLLSAVSIAEINTYLQNTLLRDTDQMSMAVALEIREPFLDYKLIEFALSIPDSYKYPHVPKKLLVDSMGDLLPDEIVNRKKMGFVLPWQIWLKNDLKSFCDMQLHSLENKTLFKKGAVIKLWQDFLKGDPGIGWARVWHLVVLSYWMNENKIHD